MATDTRASLADQLSAVLTDLDAAIRGWVPQSERQDTRRELEPDGHDKGLRAIMAAALGWFTSSTSPQPRIRRASPLSKRSRRAKRATRQGMK